MRVKIKTQKIPRASNNGNLSYPKKYLPKLSYPKKFPTSETSNPKQSFDHPCHLKSGVTPGVLNRNDALVVISKVKLSCITSANGINQRKKNEGAYSRMLREALKVSWRGHISKEDLYGSFLAR